jgi:ABC-type sugar transport system ATPase subunit
MAEVLLRNVEKSYEKNKNIINKIHLKIEPGEFVVIVGPSGCGKSTLLRMIAGLESITAGELYIDKIKVNNLPASKREIAMVFQDYALYPHMTVKKNISFGLELRKIPRAEIETRVLEVVELLGLEEFLKRKPGELSGGQRQRVAIGRAIVKNPKVFLFDEPFSNLDAQLRVQMRIELAALHRRIGSTTIFVTHDQVEAMSLADRIVVLKEGSIQQVGTPLDLYQNPSNRFVGSFIGNPGMNYFFGNYHREDGLFQTNDFKLRLDRTIGPKESGEYYLGIRPENILIVDREHSDFCVSVRTLERYGYENHFICEIGNQVILIRVSSSKSAQFLSSFKPGDQLLAHLKRSEIQWFESNHGGKRIVVQKDIYPLEKQVESS